jgi:hypothetical protein
MNIIGILSPLALASDTNDKHFGISILFLSATYQNLIITIRSIENLTGTTNQIIITLLAFWIVRPSTIGSVNGIPRNSPYNLEKKLKI